MNMQIRAYLLQRAKYGQEKMQIHLFSTCDVVYQPWEQIWWLWLQLRCDAFEEHTHAAIAEATAVVHERNESAEAV